MQIRDTSVSPAGLDPWRDEEACWQAVLRRDADADGQFYYSVSTTGVFCRPSCASRPARREHVRFHAGVQEAGAAGFRPCLRCKPDQPGLTQRHASIIASACRRIEACETMVPLAALAQEAGMSRYHFHRIFKQVTGMTPHAYAHERRAQRLRQALPQASSVTQAMYEAGFNSSAGFYRQSGAILGMPAARYRQRGSHVAIGYALSACSLGQVLVAATGQGVCAVLLGDEAEALIADLRRRFAHAESIEPEPGLAELVGQVVALIDAPAGSLALPLDLRGTLFQQRVWQALRAIPPGTTVSYTELAKRIGQPGAVRAVASACAANPLAVLIPCHRVVGSSGALSGYRWGLARKRALLESEARLAGKAPGDCKRQEEKE